MRRSTTKPNLGEILSPRLWFAVLLGCFFAVLAFSQAAASVGLPIEAFRPLGAGFFSIRTVQAEAAKRLVSQPYSADSAEVATLGRRGLVYAPLNTRALWLVGQSWDAQGQLRRARIVMRQAERVSRRDAAVQLWLGQDDLRNDKIPQGLHHFDLMIRTNSEAAKLVTPVLAKVIVSPEGRKQMAPYFRQTNPWFPDLLWAAAHTLPQGAPLARLLIEQNQTAPDGDGIRPIYAYLLKRLIDEKSYELAMRLYPKLPGANLATLHSLNPAVGGKLQEEYPPFVWEFADGDAQGGGIIGLTLANVGLEIFGSPGTVGVAASKLLVPGANTKLEWVTVQRTGNSESSANWEMTCLLGNAAGSKVDSGNLYASYLPVNRKLSMRVPGACDLFRVDLRISGGVGRTPADLVVGNFALR